MIRLHLSGDLEAGAAVAPTLEQSRYLTQVMRLGVGDGLLAFNGRDGEWRAVVAEATKRGAILRVEARTRPQAFGPDLELIVAVVKKAPLETIVEKAVELGCRRIRLALTRRTVAGHVRLDRLDAIAEEAAEQCGRLDVPVVEDPQPLGDILAASAARRLMFCDETGGAPAPEALADAPVGEAWSVLIGPEGGFTPEEGEGLRARAGTVAVSLGPRILRADTAAIAALALWQSACGDWRPSRNAP